MNNRHRPKLTPEQVQALLDDYRLPLDEGGLTVEEIALKYGVCASTVQHHTRQNHVSRPRSRRQYRDLVPVDPEELACHVLPLYHIRLVSRPAGY